MFSLGSSEIIIIAVVALLLFGPDKIPQLARTVGRFMREFNKYKDIMESTIRMEISKAEGPTVDELTVEQRIAKAGAASQALIEAQVAPPADEHEEGTEEGDAQAPGVHPAPAPVADETDEEDEE